MFGRALVAYLSLGPIRAPTHRKPAWRQHLASSSLSDGPVPAVLPQISSCPGLQRTGVVRAGRYLRGRGRGVWVSVAKPRPLSRQSPFRHHPCAPALRATLSISGIISVVVRQAAAYAGLNHRGSGRHERRGGLAVRNHPADGLRAGAELASHHHPWESVVGVGPALRQVRRAQPMGVALQCRQWSSEIWSSSPMGVGAPYSAPPPGSPSRLAPSGATRFRHPSSFP